MLRKLITTPSELVNYIAVFGLVAVSGLPFFYTAQTNIVILLVFALFFFLKRSIKFDSRVLLIMVVFYAVDILQVLLVKPFVLRTLMGTYLRLFASFFVIALCDKKFTHYYTNIIYVLSIISFIFYIPAALSPNIFDFFRNQVCPLFTSPFAGASDYYVPMPSIIVFTFHDLIPDFRNPGPFWEPGAFATFLILALIFNVINTKKLLTAKNIILSIALLTTISTAGYVAYFVLLLGYNVINQPVAKRILFILIAVPLITGLFFRLDFLNEKIENNISLAEDDNTSRFGSGLSDLKDFVKSPIIGWGKGAMRYGGKQFSFFTEDQHRNNGITDLLASYGIIIFIVYFYNYYKTFKTLCIANDFSTYFAGLAFIVILLLGFSQTIFLYPFFYGLMFLHLVYTKDKKLLT